MHSVLRSVRRSGSMTHATSKLSLSPSPTPSSPTPPSRTPPSPSHIFYSVLFESVTWDVLTVGFDRVPGGATFSDRSVLSYHLYVPPQVCSPTFDIQLCPYLQNEEVVLLCVRSNYSQYTLLWHHTVHVYTVYMYCISCSCSLKHNHTNNAFLSQSTQQWFALQSHGDYHAHVCTSDNYLDIVWIVLVWISNNSIIGGNGWWRFMQV